MTWPPNAFPSLPENSDLVEQGNGSPVSGIGGKDLIQRVLFAVILILLLVPFGRFMARVYTGEHTILTPVTAPIETWVYRVLGTSPDEEMDWKSFAIALLVFNILGIIIVFLAEGPVLPPPNPAGLGTVYLGPLPQYRSEFCHQYQLAGVCRGGDPELPYPDDRPHRAEFCLGSIGMAVLVALILRDFHENLPRLSGISGCS